MTDASCPKCGFARDPAAADCPACGIVYARYRPRSAPGGGGAARGPATTEASSTGGPAAGGGDLYQGDLPAGDVYRGEGEATNPYGAPQALVLRPGRLVGTAEQSLAGRGSRLAARFVDGLILVAIVIVPLLLGGGLDPASKDIADAALLFMGLGMLSVGGVNLYLLGKSGQTMGKRALKIRIVMLDGGEARLGRIVVMRILAPNLLGSVPIVGPIFGLANILFIFGAEQRCLHDHMAGTKVVMV